ncbi:phage major capsid protein [Microbacterium enclense]|uniref:phage major capsid protein n=1 Tax=Microbacterium enclense TaxID=993073 RepID=UPI0021A89CBD|nr:phage major capsid protein [Microbacterium enclense]MCT2085045.1 phage major capsid protein [Microbacterium enclense]
MDPREELAQLQKELLGIKTKAAGEKRSFTDDELTDIETKSARVAELKARIDRIEKSEKALSDLVNFGKSSGAADDVADDWSDVPLGERFTKSDPYRRFKTANPSGTGQGTPIMIETVRIGSMKDFFANRKALTSPQARIQNIRVPMVDMVDRDELTLLDLISRGETAGNFEYVQVISVTRNAKIVPEATSGTDNAALKPVSEISTQLADAKVYTYADGYDVTNQLLADAPAFASYMDQELRYSLDNVIEDKLLNGSGVSGEPKGILNTTGIQDHEFTGSTPKDLVKAIRRGITKVTRHGIGGRVTAVLISPEDEEEIDLMEDGNQRFYGQGPFGLGPNTLWGRPRVTSERIEPGTFLLGDFKQIALLDREGLSVQAFNQHKDYAQRNMTYVRGELRAAQVVWKPNRLVFGHRGTVQGG